MATAFQRVFAELRAESGGLKAQEVKQGSRRYWQRTELTEEHRAMLPTSGDRSRLRRGSLDRQPFEGSTCLGAFLHAVIRRVRAWELSNARLTRP